MSEELGTMCQPSTNWNMRFFHREVTSSEFPWVSGWRAGWLIIIPFPRGSCAENPDFKWMCGIHWIYWALNFSSKHKSLFFKLVLYLLREAGDLEGQVAAPAELRPCTTDFTSPQLWHLPCSVTTWERCTRSICKWSTMEGKHRNNYL